MHADLPKNPEPAFRAPERTSPCRITYTRGRAPFWPPRGARRNLGARFRLIRAVSTWLTHQSCIDLAFCVHSVPNRVGASGAGHARSKGKVVRPDRVSGNEARWSPPARVACFPHPVQMSSRGVRAAAGKVCLEVNNDKTSPVSKKEDRGSRPRSVRRYDCMFEIQPLR
jgi:hypothetical protein